ncbi:type II secretion system F family protein [Effusibacillus dendaii]|uniref:Type II secretion system protein GspF domain-containing protein n=1 Tax=Effusibacillus dendaii TaxID=2743772 RepID=A0A7I8DDL9_9BACL|nr:type II secretion system F family protein [Effusibacillus dendaii]BCJ86620.1 hypothetical protein skT53_16050 [Effusibacillus dendaii]
MWITYFSILISMFCLLRLLKEIVQLARYGNLPDNRTLVKRIRQLKSGAADRPSNRRHSSVQVKHKTVFAFLVPTVLFMFCFSIGWLFFRNGFYAFLFGFVGLIYPRIREYQRAIKRKQLMLIQFRNVLSSITNSVKAGSSLETAFLKCQFDLQTEFSTSRDKPMWEEIEKLNRNLQFGYSMEDSLLKFKSAVGIEELAQFADAILIVRAKGGNLAEVMNNTAEMIADKIEIQEEIKVATSQKRLESNVLTFTPIVIIVTILLLNPGYLQPMYESPLGTGLLFIGTLLLFANFFLARYILSIDV